jgi:hypothetical protein
LLDEPLKERHTPLLTEIRQGAGGSIETASLPAPDSLLWGGTPSLLTPAEVRSIVDECRRS